MSRRARAAIDVRVLYVIDSLHHGGAEQSLVALAPELRRAGVDLHVAYLHERPGLASELRSAGAVLHSLSGSESRIQWLRRCRDVLRTVAPELVHTTLFEADQVGRLAARSCGVPVVSSLVGMRFGPEQRSNPQIRSLNLRAAQALDLATSRLVRRFHAVSHAIARTMSQRIRIPSARIDVVHRGRDASALGVRSDERRARAREQLRLEDEPVALVVARHEHVKGLDVLVEAVDLVVKRLGGAIAVVAGPTGGQTPLLQRRIDELDLGDHVRLLGSRLDVPELMCAADALVLPSRSEGFPGVLLEAMALELPIVASDLPSVREVVGQEGALLFEREDPRALADELVEVLRSPPDVRSLRDRFLARFTIEASARGMVGFYERALAQTARGR